MTDSNYTLTDMTGSFKITVYLDQDDPEPLPATCRRALANFATQGIVPEGVLITELAATRTPGGDMVFCTVDWKQGEPWPS